MIALPVMRTSQGTILPSSIPRPKISSKPALWRRRFLLGGVEMARILHRLAALVTFGYFIFHLIRVFWLRVARSTFAETSGSPALGRQRHRQLREDFGSVAER